MYCIPVSAVLAALGSLGPVEEWTKKSDSSTARHTGDIAVIGTYANAAIAYRIIDLRIKAWNGGRPRNAKENDKRLIETFVSADKRFREMTQPAVKIARVSFWSTVNHDATYWA